jgi:hypothetical protein
MPSASGLISSIWNSIDDGIVALPIILTGFQFILGSLTSNVGLLWLFLGHLILVPSMLNLSNSFGKATDFVEFLKLFFGRNVGFISAVVLGLTAYFAYTKDELAEDGTLAGATVIPWLGFLIFPILTKYAIQQATGSPPTSSGSSATCQMFPGDSPSAAPQYALTTWVAHTVFFFSFVITNAIYVFQMPAPTLTETLPDQKKQAQRQADLDEKVSTRKGLSATIAGLAALMLAVLLFIRWKTDCEPSFTMSALPVALVGYYGFLWFRTVVKSCGVNPIDILGIVRGMTDPNFQDKPIVCIGEKS